jgi:nitrogen permease regulator 3-like protein
MSVLWKEILQNSTLAASMAEIYDAVSHNRVASLHLETAAGSLTPSLQIPVPFYVADLPQAGELDLRGLWLTTANAIMSQDAMDEPGFLDRNFALLLMDDEKKIVAELQADADQTTVSMVEFVRLCKPTMS